MRANAVFEGGGVRGIGHVGALCYLEGLGYKWDKVAGTSSGAIIATLIAAGYTANELKEILLETNLSYLINNSYINLSFLDKAVELLKQKGIYSGKNAELWFENLLNAKGISTFGDLESKCRTKLKITATDITRKCVITFPDDLVKYNINPMSFKVARALRMSISIPLYFKPVKLQYDEGESYIVDGGLLWNYPITMFDTNEKPEIPTFGMHFEKPTKSYVQNEPSNIITYLSDIEKTISINNNLEYTERKNYDRTIFIPTYGVDSTDFNLSKNQMINLFKGGYKSAEKFMHFWSLEDYTLKYFGQN